MRDALWKIILTMRRITLSASRVD
jgi:hypothetical protein